MMLPGKTMVTLHEAVKPPSFDLAVMTTGPVLTPVTTPLFTDATAVFELVQLRPGKVASGGETVAARGWGQLSATSFVAGRLTEATWMGFVTVTEHVSENPPSTALAVIVALPRATPVTTPSAVTVAMPGLLDVQPTSLFEALSGLMVATSIFDCPMATLMVSPPRARPLTAILKIEQDRAQTARAASAAAKDLDAFFLIIPPMGRGCGLPRIGKIRYRLFLGAVPWYFASQHTARHPRYQRAGNFSIADGSCGNRPFLQKCAMEQQIILDGAALSKEIEASLSLRVAALKERHSILPTLATIMVGDDPSSKIYVNMKGRACQRCGIQPEKIILGPESTTEDVVGVIRSLNERPEVYGILLQHPVPRAVDEKACFDAISPDKDVDGVTTINFGRMALGERAFVSATPGGIMRLLAHYGIPVSGKRAVVVGRSPILGKPVSMLLLNADATVTICHSKTADLEATVRGADILVAAVGKEEFVKADWIQEGCVVVDAGYHKGGIGDVERAAYAKASAYTPMPGGVGPMTIAILMEQTVEAAERAAGIR